MKCSLADIEGLSVEIENLRTRGPEELDQTWRELFGSDRPRRVCGDLLIKAIGYRLQAKAIGGLKPSTRLPAFLAQCEGFFRSAVDSWQPTVSARAGS